MLRENVQTIGGKLSMNTVKVRNIEIGSGVPKICVPIVGVTKDEIITKLVIVPLILGNRSFTTAVAI